MSTQTANRSGGGGGGGRNKASKANSQQKEKQKENEAVLNSANDTNTNSTKDKKTATEHVKPEKEKPQIKPTAEQIRIAQITDIKGGMEDTKIREKVEKLMEMTQRSEEDVCCALYECDNDLEKAVIFLLEQLPVNAFATTSKKKKNRQAASSDANTGDGDWNNENAAPNSGSKDSTDKDKPRNRQGGPGQRNERGSGRPQRDGRGGGRRENDRNGAPNFKVDTFRADGDSRPRGGRGGFNSSRGRGGRPENREAGRSNYRGNRSNRNQGGEMQEIDSWEPSQGMSADQQKQEVHIDTWGDWDNEEYTGSLTDTKVFTPSTSTSTHGVTSSQAPELSAPPGLEQQMLNPPVQQQTTQQVDSYSSAITQQSQVTATGANQAQYPEIHSSTTAAPHLRQALERPQITSSTLSAEQSQYFNTLSSQNSNVNSYQTNSVQYQTNYGTPNQYGSGADQVQQQAPQTRRPPARARVPPPSKIPSTAVEMPGDAINNMGFLDVQFGGLDFGTDESFESVTEKFSATSLDSAQTIPNVADVSDYQNKSATQKALTGSALQSSQILSNNDTLNAQTDSLSSSYTQRNSSSVPTPASGTSNYQLGKSDPYNQGSTNQATVYQSSTYSAQNKAPSYQSTQGYGSSSYSNSSQVTSNNNYPPSSNNSYNSYSQSYQQQQQNSNTNTGTGVGSVSSVSSGVSNNNASQSIPVNSSSVNNNNANTNTGYLSNQYPVNQTSSTYPSQPSAYQTNQSVYGNTGLTNSSGYSSSTNSVSGQYNNFSTSSKLKDTPVSTPFDSTSSTNVSSTATSSSVTTSNMSSPSLGLTNTKVTNSTAKSGTTVVPNISMVSQYIQTPGMPFYQPQVYSYEEMQLLQQRVSHVPGYYDINYQAPTSLGAAGVRDANLSSMAYSTMADGRFTRTDNNSSPVSNVPSTMSQQAGSGGPMLNLPNVPYAYFYPNNAMMPGSYQFSTPAIYTQQMGTANATSGQQFPKPSYNNAYGSTNYDTLNQTTQDYNKTPYASSGVGQQSKGQTVSNPQSGAGSDLTSSMYSKSHAALNKVNSYEKQSFHSGTPPPFNVVGSQTTLNSVNAASGQPYGSQHLYIAAPHHNMNMHQPHQDSSSTGQRQQNNSQGKSSTKQGYSPSYWTAQN